MAKADTKKTEDQVLVPTPDVVVLNNGEKYTIPPITWGREIRILRVIRTVLNGVFGEAPKRIPQITEGMSDDDRARVAAEIAAINAQMTQHLLTVLLDEGPEQILGVSPIGDDVVVDEEQESAVLERIDLGHDLVDRAGAIGLAEERGDRAEGTREGTAPGRRKGVPEQVSVLG